MNRQSTRTLTTAVLGAMLAIGSIAPAFAQRHDDSNKDDLNDQRAQRHERRSEQRKQAPQIEQTPQVPEQSVPRPQENWGQQAQQQAERRDSRRVVDSPEPNSQPRDQLRQHRDERRQQMQQRLENTGVDPERSVELQRQLQQRNAASRHMAEQRAQEDRRNNHQQQATRVANARAEADQRAAAALQRTNYDRRDYRGQDLRNNSAHRSDDRRNERDDYVGDNRGDNYPGNRLPNDEQRRLIDQQRSQASMWQRNEAARGAQIERRSREFERQRRHSQSLYQQDYYRRWHAQQSRWNAPRYNYYNDPYYYTASNFRYGYGGRWYNTNQYGANLLQQAVRDGYQEGYYAGRADRQDRWRFDYRNSYAYTDGSYGYNGYYVSANDYRYYFRQGFERGYSDAYYGRNQYGRYDNNNGLAFILPVILTAILGFQNY